MNPSDPNQNVTGDTPTPPASGETFVANTSVPPTPAVAASPQPAQPTVQPAQPMQQPTAGVTATTAQAAQVSPPATPVNLPKKSKKPIFIGLIIITVMLLAGAAYWFFLSLNIEPDNSGLSKEELAPSVETVSTPPTGWVTRDRKCFTLALPEKNDLSTEDNSCLFATRFGTNNQLMSIFAFSNNSTSLETEVAQWKEDQKGTPMTIVSEADEKSGDYDAKRIIYKSPPSSPNQSIIYFVYTKDSYKVENNTINGFVFRSTYSSVDYSDYTENINNVLKNITWK